MPLQLPASTVTAAPIVPMPLSAGAVTAAGLMAATLTLKLTEADPPEFVAVTVTATPESSVPVGRLTTPLAGSIVAPAPVTV